MGDAELALEHLQAIRNLRIADEMSHTDQRAFTNAMALETSHWRRLCERIEYSELRPPFVGEASCDGP